MYICITAQGDNLEAKVDTYFGRCAYYIFISTDTMDFEAVKNPSITLTGGAGVQSGQLVAARKAHAVLTGHVGSNAFQTLKVAGIEVITGVSGKVKDAVEKYKKGELKKTTSPDVDLKFGMPEGK